LPPEQGDKQSDQDLHDDGEPMNSAIIDPYEMYGGDAHDQK
jgi:hypothetical protein